MTEDTGWDGRNLWKGFLALVVVLIAITLGREWQAAQEHEAVRAAQEQREVADRSQRVESQTPDSTREERFQAREQEAREAWEQSDGFWTTIAYDPDDVPTRNLWKSARRHNDLTPGIAPVVRKRLRVGQRLLIYDGSVTIQGVDMWKVTDGETFGWISELQLDSAPEGDL